MSRIAGIFYFDFRPVAESVRGEFVRHFSGPAAAAIHLYRGPGLLMASESPDSSGFGSSAEGSCCAFDGRLDNGRLPGQAPDSQPSTAPALILELYDARGAASFGDLLGDWSMAIWDARARTVLLASDYAGVRPLYYQQTSEAVVWSSSLGKLVEWTGRAELDEDFAAEFLGRGLVRNRTPYRGAYSVPPGSSIRISPGRVTVSRFWELPMDRSIRFEREADYEERLRALFEEAVAVRLSASSPAWAELSGGLDSSSVVSVAHHLIQSGRVGAQSLTTISYLTEGTTDEKFLLAVEQAFKLPTVHLRTAEYPPIAPQLAGCSAPLMWEARFTEVARRMRETASSAFLTGQLGDLIMGNALDESEQVADYLRERRFRKAISEAFAWSHSLQIPVYLVLWRALRVDSAPSSDLAHAAAERGTYGDSLSTRLRRSAQELSSGDQQAGRLRGARPSLRKKLRALNEFLESRAFQTPEPMEGLAFTHPYLHRPLVEYMLAIPPAVVCRPGEPRRLMRRALAGIVPEIVLRRRSKGTYDSAYIQALRPCAMELVRRGPALRLVELGWVDPQSTARRLQRLIDGLQCNEAQLRRLILLELWLRNRQQRATRCGESPKTEFPNAMPAPG